MAPISSQKYARLFSYTFTNIHLIEETGEKLENAGKMRYDTKIRLL